MNPFVQDIGGAVVRTLIGIMLGWLVKQQLITGEQAEAWITGLSGAVIILAWSLYQKYTSRQKLVTALASPAGSTERRVEQVISEGDAPPVTIPKHVPPYLPTR